MERCIEMDLEEIGGDGMKWI